ncbi:acetyl-CoA carboxylase biotin carboxyl carrier protein [Rhodoferax ferrireducens]|uniref:Acetyl-CoA carboxylase biotin carboxyl carrier protein n=1 Tax=Rhodoferax ferrireducens TaxID=192843 RepID=A0ABU2CF44_9BURK|nr:acetyl-CoA carboxylase [Rhodoferax ferrireducens]MDR7379965.1 acetyl-CoA carboxylase biotin carboxyl carrier protein [Rhodoferax ferrireducens]
MQTQDISQLAAWLAETDIDFLELHGPDEQIEIHRDGSTNAAIAQPMPPEPIPAHRTAHTPVRATSVGVLLDRIPGHATPLWLPGSAVQAGSLLGLLQVGPLLLPVHAPCDGWPGEWQVPPGSTVGYGTTLLDIDTEPVADAI